MSIADNLARRNNEVEQEVAQMQAAMMRSGTGVAMLQKSQAMANSEQMMQLMAMIGEPSIPEKERMTLAQYMGEMLKRDPIQGLEKYAQYLEGVAADPRYAKRKEYYLSVGAAARAVGKTPVYQEYITAYNAFEADMSEEAKAARDATQRMQEKMRAWAEVE